MIQTLYNLDEITLIPAKISTIKSRSSCDTRYGDKLPIFVSPMACLTNKDNVDTYRELGINAIIPRTVPFCHRVVKLTQGYWVAVGFREAMYLYNEWSQQIKKSGRLSYVPYLCIDQAQGHLEDLLKLCKDLKYLLGKTGIVLMTGNIANPDAYYEYAIHGVDYVRVSVGTGHGCTTSCQTGFHYPMGSLLTEINKIRKEVKRDLLSGALFDGSIYTEPKVVADGGLHINAQIIKALALGADYVMLGEIIGKSEEACGVKCLLDEEWDDVEDDYVEKNGRLYYGMSTERAQKEINEASLYRDPQWEPKRSEGIVKIIPIEYKLKDWLTDLDTDLRSAMSYANATNLNEFIGKVRWAIISHDSYMKFMGKVIK